MKEGSGGTYGSFVTSPTLSVSAGTKDVYLQVQLTQNKTVVGPPETGTDVVRITKSSINSANLNVNWQIGPAP